MILYNILKANKTMKNNFKHRKIARKCVLQGLFCISINVNNKKRIKNYLLKKNKKTINVTYFNKLFFNIPKTEHILDAYIKKNILYNLSELSTVELIILRIALFELLYIRLPKKVIICEALQLTMTYGSHKSYKFINTVLDKTFKNYVAV